MDDFDKIYDIVANNRNRFVDKFMKILGTVMGGSIFVIIFWSLEWTGALVGWLLFLLFTIGIIWYEK